MSERTAMGSHEARVAVEVVDDMVRTRRCENIWGMAIETGYKSYVHFGGDGSNRDISTHPGPHECL